MAFMDDFVEAAKKIEGLDQLNDVTFTPELGHFVQERDFMYRGQPNLHSDDWADAELDEKLTDEELAAKRKRAKQAGYRDSEHAGEAILATVGEIASTLQDPFNINEIAAVKEERGSADAGLAKAGSVLGGIAGGFASMPFDAAAEIAEAATGTPFKESHGGKIADYTMDADQRIAAGVDAAVNILGMVPGVGSTGAAVAGAAKAAKAVATGTKAASKVGKFFTEGAKAFNEIGKGAKHAKLINFGAQTGINVVEGGIGGAAQAVIGDQDQHGWDNAVESGTLLSGALEGAGMGAGIGTAFHVIGKGLSKAGDVIGQQTKKADRIRKIANGDYNWSDDPELWGDDHEVDIEGLTKGNYSAAVTSAEGISDVVGQKMTDNMTDIQQKQKELYTAKIQSDPSLVAEEMMPTTQNFIVKAQHALNENGEEGLNNYLEVHHIVDEADKNTMIDNIKNKKHQEIANTLNTILDNGNDIFGEFYKDPAGNQTGITRTRAKRYIASERNEIYISNDMAVGKNADFDGDPGAYRYTNENDNIGGEYWDSTYQEKGKTTTDSNAQNIQMEKFGDKENFLRTHIDAINAALDAHGIDRNVFWNEYFRKTIDPNDTLIPGPKNANAVLTFYAKHLEDGYDRYVNKKESGAIDKVTEDQFNGSLFSKLWDTYKSICGDDMRSARNIMNDTYRTIALKQHYMDVNEPYTFAVKLSREQEKIIAEGSKFVRDNTQSRIVKDNTTTNASQTKFQTKMAETLGWNDVWDRVLKGINTFFRLQSPGKYWAKGSDKISSNTIRKDMITKTMYSTVGVTFENVEKASKQLKNTSHLAFMDSVFEKIKKAGRTDLVSVSGSYGDEHIVINFNKFSKEDIDNFIVSSWKEVGEYVHTTLKEINAATGKSEVPFYLEWQENKFKDGKLNAFLCEVFTNEDFRIEFKTDTGVVDLNSLTNDFLVRSSEYIKGNPDNPEFDVKGFIRDNEELVSLSDDCVNLIDRLIRQHLQDMQKYGYRWDTAIYSGDKKSPGILELVASSLYAAKKGNDNISWDALSAKDKQKIMNWYATMTNTNMHIQSGTIGLTALINDPYAGKWLRMLIDLVNKKGEIKPKDFIRIRDVLKEGQLSLACRQFEGLNNKIHKFKEAYLNYIRKTKKENIESFYNLSWSLLQDVYDELAQIQGRINLAGGNNLYSDIITFYASAVHLFSSFEGADKFKELASSDIMKQFLVFMDRMITVDETPVGFDAKTKALQGFVSSIKDKSSYHSRTYTADMLRGFDDSIYDQSFFVQKRAANKILKSELEFESVMSKSHIENISKAKKYCSNKGVNFSTAIRNRLDMSLRHASPKLLASKLSDMMAYCAHNAEKNRAGDPIVAVSTIVNEINNAFTSLNTFLQAMSSNKTQTITARNLQEQSVAIIKMISDREGKTKILLQADENSSVSKPITFEEWLKEEILTDEEFSQLNYTENSNGDRVIDRDNNDVMYQRIFEKCPKLAEHLYDVEYMSSNPLEGDLVVPKILSGGDFNQMLVDAGNLNENPNIEINQQWLHETIINNALQNPQLLMKVVQNAINFGTDVVNLSDIISATNKSLVQHFIVAEKIYLYKITGRNVELKNFTENFKISQNKKFDTEYKKLLIDNVDSVYVGPGNENELFNSTLNDGVEELYTELIKKEKLKKLQAGLIDKLDEIKKNVNKGVDVVDEFAERVNENLGDIGSFVKQFADDLVDTIKDSSVQAQYFKNSFYSYLVRKKNQALDIQPEPITKFQKTTKRAQGRAEKIANKVYDDLGINNNFFKDCMNTILDELCERSETLGKLLADRSTLRELLLTKALDRLNVDRSKMFKDFYELTLDYVTNKVKTFQDILDFYQGLQKDIPIKDRSLGFLGDKEYCDGIEQKINNGTITQEDIDQLNNNAIRSFINFYNAETNRSQIKFDAYIEIDKFINSIEESADTFLTQGNTETMPVMDKTSNIDWDDESIKGIAETRLNYLESKYPESDINFAYGLYSTNLENAALAKDQLTTGQNFMRVAIDGAMQPRWALGAKLNTLLPPDITRRIDLRKGQIINAKREILNAMTDNLYVKSKDGVFSIDDKLSYDEVRAIILDQAVDDVTSLDSDAFNSAGYISPITVRVNGLTRWIFEKSGISINQNMEWVDIRNTDHLTKLFRTLDQVESGELEIPQNLSENNTFEFGETMHDREMAYQQMISFFMEQRILKNRKNIIPENMKLTRSLTEGVTINDDCVTINGNQFASQDTLVDDIMTRVVDLREALVDSVYATQFENEFDKSSSPSINELNIKARGKDINSFDATPYKQMVKYVNIRLNSEPGKVYTFYVGEINDAYHGAKQLSIGVDENGNDIILNASDIKSVTINVMDQNNYGIDVLNRITDIRADYERTNTNLDETALRRELIDSFVHPERVSDDINLVNTINENMSYYKRGNRANYVFLEHESTGLKDTIWDPYIDMDITSNSFVNRFYRKRNNLLLNESLRNSDAIKNNLQYAEKFGLGKDSLITNIVGRDRNITETPEYSDSVTYQSIIESPTTELRSKRALIENVMNVNSYLRQEGRISEYAENCATIALEMNNNVAETLVSEFDKHKTIIFTDKRDYDNFLNYYQNKKDNTGNFVSARPEAVTVDGRTYYKISDKNFKLNNIADNGNIRFDHARIWTGTGKNKKRRLSFVVIGNGYGTPLGGRIGESNAYIIDKNFYKDATVDYDNDEYKFNKISSFDKTKRVDKAYVLSDSNEARDLLKKLKRGDDSVLIDINKYKDELHKGIDETTAENAVMPMLEKIQINGFRNKLTRVKKGECVALYVVEYKGKKYITPIFNTLSFAETLTIKNNLDGSSYDVVLDGRHNVADLIDNLDEGQNAKVTIASLAFKAQGRNLKPGDELYIGPMVSQDGISMQMYIEDASLLTRLVGSSGDMAKAGNEVLLIAHNTKSNFDILSPINNYFRDEYDGDDILVNKGNLKNTDKNIWLNKVVPNFEKIILEHFKSDMATFDAKFNNGNQHFGTNVTPEQIAKEVAPLFKQAITRLVRQGINPVWYFTKDEIRMSSSFAALQNIGKQFTYPAINNVEGRIAAIHKMYYSLMDGEASKVMNYNTTYDKVDIDNMSDKEILNSSLLITNTDENGNVVKDNNGETSFTRRPVFVVNENFTDTVTDMMNIPSSGSRSLNQELTTAMVTGNFSFLDLHEKIVGKGIIEGTPRQVRNMYKAVRKEDGSISFIRTGRAYAHTENPHVNYNMVIGYAQDKKYNKFMNLARRDNLMKNNCSYEIRNPKDGGSNLTIDSNEVKEWLNKIHKAYGKNIDAFKEGSSSFYNREAFNAIMDEAGVAADSHGGNVIISWNRFINAAQSVIDKANEENPLFAGAHYNLNDKAHPNIVVTSDTRSPIAKRFTTRRSTLEYYFGGDNKKFRNPDTNEFWTVDSYLDYLCRENAKIIEDYMGQIDESFVEDQAKRIAIRNACIVDKINLGYDPSTFMLAGIPASLRDKTYLNIFSLCYNSKDEFSGLYEKSFQRAKNLSNAQATYVRNYWRNKNYKIEKSADVDNVVYSRLKYAKLNNVNKFFDYTANLSRAMGVLSPGVLIENVLDKAIGYNFGKIFNILNQKILKGEYLQIGLSESDTEALIKLMRVNPELNAIGDILHLVDTKGNRDEAMMIREKLATGELTPTQVVAEYKKRGVWMDKAYSAVMKWGTGEFAFSKQRTENYIRYLLHTIMQDEDLVRILSKKDVYTIDGKAVQMTAIQAMMKDDPIETMKSLMLGSPSKGIYTQMASANAWNMTLRHDWVHDNLVARGIDAIFKTSALKWGVTMLGCKYVRASTNILGRSLQWTLPMNSMHYAATAFVKMLADKPHIKEKLAAHGPLKNYFKNTPEFIKADMDALRTYTDLRTHIIMDVMHLGLGAVATAIMGALFLEPPEDKRKWINYKEWTVCGMRIENVWWLDDIFGLALPMACFWKSAELGQAMPGIFVKGLIDHVQSNPFAKIGEAFQTVINPTHQYEDDSLSGILDSYDRSKFGKPENWLDYTISSMPSMCFSMVAQMTTPSFLKEWLQVSDDYERSYKRTWKRNDRGQLVEGAKEKGLTEYVDFAEAQNRRILMNAPLLGTIWGALKGNPLEYYRYDMPINEVYEPIQMSFMKKYSVVDEKGELKDSATTNQISISLLEMLSANNDMSALRDAGFCINKETREFMGKLLHDCYQSIKDDFEYKKLNGYLDPYVLGDGDYTAGKKIYNEFYKTYQEQLSFYQDLYANKLYSKELVQPMDKYQIYNTKWAQDSSGRWYATGVRESVGGAFSPFQLAPTSLSKTAGKEGDWASLSSLTGKALVDEQGNALRALVPVEQEAYTPKLDSWATAKNYSSNYDNSYSKYTGNRSSGGYGGGGGSRSIYSHAPNMNLASAATPRQSNLRRTQYDYLRPSFEIAGSSKSQKREAF